MVCRDNSGIERAGLVAAVEQAADAIVITGVDGTIQYVNPAFTTLTGYSREEAVGQNPRFLKSGQTPQEVYRELWSTIVSGRVWHGEVINRRKNGTVYREEMQITPVEGAAGQIVSFIAVKRDVTRLGAERDAQAFLATIVQGSEDAIVAYSPSGTILTWNRGAETVFGYGAAEAIGKPMSMLLPSDRQHVLASAPEHVRAGTFISNHEGVGLHRDGRRIPLLGSGSPVRNAAGELIAISMILRDVSERKRYERELIRAREAADAANVAKSRFLANMSHEIRTPMNGVIGMMQLLLETALSAEQRRYASVAQASGQVLLSLIDNVLDLSKIEARKVTLEKFSFNLRHTLESVVQLLGIQAKAKALNLALRVSPEIPELLRGDPHRLRQILTNLVTNAVKFTERGEVAVEAALQKQADGQVTVAFRIVDTGIGMRPDEIARLFQPFAQADTSTTRKYGGTGLGLIISKQLVEMMGGKIGVHSLPGLGSTFWFTAVFETAEPEVAQPVTGGVDRRNRGPVPGLRILVVEDNPVNREVLLAQLSRLGYQAAAVENGAEAVEALAAAGYDLVLMDCQMPVMDGFEATLHIREVHRSDIPIVAVTADAMPADRDRCLQAGMNDYLAKPVELQRLADMLAKWLPAPSAGGSAEARDDPNPQGPMIFNQDALMGRLLGDQDLAGAILLSFVGDCPARLDELRQRIAEADASGARLLAHSLKGAAATVAAEELCAFAGAIEQAGAKGQVARCAELMPRGMQVLERFRGALESAGWIADPGGDTVLRTNHAQS
jgi:PAS domain S-box-containing protein